MRNTTRQISASALQPAGTGAVRMSKVLKIGTVWVNTYRAISYMMSLGGVKRSDMGCKSGIEVILEHLLTKLLWTNTSDAAPRNTFVMR